MATNAEKTDSDELTAEETVDEFDAAFDEADNEGANKPPEPNGDEDDSDDFDDADDGNDIDTDNEDPEPKENDDPWSSVPESLKAERDKLFNENSALRGRVPGLNRELDDARKKLAEHEARLSKRKDEDLDEDDDGEDTVADFKNEYPEIAGPVERMLREQQSVIDELRGKVDRHDQSFTADELQRNYAVLSSDDAVGALYQDVKMDGPRNAEFVEWYQTQPREVQAMVEKNGEKLVDAQVARTVMTLFQASSPQPTPGKGNEPNARDRRNKTLLAGAAGVKHKSAGVGRSIPDKDAYDAAWDYAEEQSSRK